MVEKENKVEEEKQEEENLTAIGQAQKLHESIKTENDRHEALLERQEKLAAQNLLGGTSTAGQGAPEKKELTDEEYKDAIMKGETPDAPK